ncbi:MAG: hypothetical protein U9Q66_03835 [Patescibacteria group bacterium]|nr:hypothetical protein [Patescibacteria group bacterium]
MSVLSVKLNAFGDLSSINTSASVLALKISLIQPTVKVAFVIVEYDALVGISIFTLFQLFIVQGLLVKIDQVEPLSVDILYFQPDTLILDSVFIHKIVTGDDSILSSLDTHVRSVKLKALGVVSIPSLTTTVNTAVDLFHAASLIS